MDFAGKNVFVTGAGGYIGLPISSKEVALDATSILSSRLLSFIRWLITHSAIGERQMLPRHTNITFIIRSTLEYERQRSVLLLLDKHMRSENAVFDDYAFIANFLRNSLVEIPCSVGKFCVPEIGTISGAFAERACK